MTVRYMKAPGFGIWRDQMVQIAVIGEREGKQEGKLHLGVATEDGHKETWRLFSAAQNGQREVVETLLVSGANVNQDITNGGVTPLYIAAQNGHTEIVESLLAFGAQISPSTSVLKLEIVELLRLPVSQWLVARQTELNTQLKNFVPDVLHSLISEYARPINLEGMTSFADIRTRTASLEGMTSKETIY